MFFLKKYGCVGRYGEVLRRWVYVRGVYYVFGFFRLCFFVSEAFLEVFNFFVVEKGVLGFREGRGFV